MALTSRLSHPPTTTTDPEDHFASSLGVIFPDDVTNQHSSDDTNVLLYTSPHLPSPLSLRLARVHEEADRYLFSHYLWNAALLLAELVEADTLKLPPGPPPPTETTREKTIAPGAGAFDVSGLRTIELGAGAGLPSIMAALVGARGAVATDYPSPMVLEALQGNVAAAVREGNAAAAAAAFTVEDVRVEGHGWGELDTAFAREARGRYDRVMAADVLWMPWQHENLRRSIAWFLKEGETARAWVVGGFHTGRETVGAFFEREALAEAGLEVEHLWERDCDGLDREWAWDRGVEETSVRKRWLAVGVLKRITSGGRAKAETALS
jgi:predicted nicotinamide N-methyase